MNGYLNEPVTTSGSSRQSNDKSVVHSTLGDRLKERREAMRLTRMDVASQLNLRLDIIESFENNDYSSIPRIVFARGYLRSYTRLLDLPSDELITAFNDLEWSEKKLSPVSTASLKMMQKRAPRKEHSIIPWIALAVLILIFCIAGFWNPITQTLGFYKTELATHSVKTAETATKTTGEAIPKKHNNIVNDSTERSSLPNLGELLHEG